jgi:hypothetical protein
MTDFDPTINAFIEPIASTPPEFLPKALTPAPKAGAERPYVQPTPPTCCATDDIASADKFVVFAAGLAIGIAVACAFSKASSVCDASV